VTGEVTNCSKNCVTTAHRKPGSQAWEAKPSSEVAHRVTNLFSNVDSCRQYSHLYI
jgi:hypothetical protein